MYNNNTNKTKKRNEKKKRRQEYHAPSALFESIHLHAAQQLNIRFFFLDRFDSVFQFIF